MCSRLYSAPEICRLVRQRASGLRTDRKLRRADCAAATGISVFTIARFKRSGQVTFDVVVKIAIALAAERELLALFPMPDFASIEDVRATHQRPQRVRKRTKHADSTE